MSYFLDGFYESRLMNCRKPLEDPKPAIEPPKIAGFKGEVKEKVEKKKDPTERLKKALPKSIKNQTKTKEPTIRLKNEFITEEAKVTTSKLDGVIINLIRDAEDNTIDKLYRIITEKLDNENVVIKNIRNKRKFILNLL